MKKRIAAVLIVISIVMVIGSIGSFALFNKTIRKTNCATWTEVPIAEMQEEPYVMLSDTVDFDPQEIASETDFAFRGTVIDGHEYLVEWYDENQEYWGPFRKSVLTVKINKICSGESPTNNDTIKIYFPFSLSIGIKNGSQIILGNEYVFLTRKLDEEFIEYRNTEAPYDNIGQENMADVYISNTDHDIMPVEGTQIIMHHDYFSWDANVVNQQSYDLPETDAILPEFNDSHYFVSMDIEDFYNVFSALFKNPEKLPNADELKKIQSEKSSSHMFK